MFKGAYSRIVNPFDAYRRGMISHEATHALHARADNYS